MSFSSIPVRSNGEQVLASWFNLLRTAGLASGGWEKITVSHTALQTAATTNDVELFSLASQGVFSGLVLKHTTAFAGTSITAYDLTVGVSGDLDKYALPFDVFQAVGDTVFQVYSFGEMESFGSATSIRLSATSTGADLDASTAGSVDAYILRSALP